MTPLIYIYLLQNVRKICWCNVWRILLAKSQVEYSCQRQVYRDYSHRHVDSLPVCHTGMELRDIVIHRFFYSLVLWLLKIILVYLTDQSAGCWWSYITWRNEINEIKKYMKVYTHKWRPTNQKMCCGLFTAASAIIKDTTGTACQNCYTFSFQETC